MQLEGFDVVRQLCVCEHLYRIKKKIVLKFGESETNIVIVSYHMTNQ